MSEKFPDIPTGDPPIVQEILVHQSRYTLACLYNDLATGIQPYALYWSPGSVEKQASHPDG